MRERRSIAWKIQKLIQDNRQHKKGGERKGRYGLKEELWTNDEEKHQVRQRALDDFFFFAVEVLENEAYDNHFHGTILANVAMHGETRCLTEGDYYFPRRSDLIRASSEGWGDYLLSHFNVDMKTTVDSSPHRVLLEDRLRTPPTAMDGSFRGVFVRISDPLSMDIKQILVPRGHLKTTFMTVAYNLWCIVRDPTDTILITMNSRENSRNVINEMKRVFEQSHRFQELFPELIWPNLLLSGDRSSGAKARRTDDYRWQADQFDVRRSNTGEFVGHRECSIVGHGIGGRLTSRHARRLHFDDLVDEKTVKTDTGIKQNIIDYQAMQALGIGEDTRKVYIGTPWHYADLSQYLLHSGESGLYNTTVVIATVEDVDGEAFYPRPTTHYTSRGVHPGFTKKLIKGKARSFQKSGLYSSQYLMQPVAASAQSFKAEWYKFFVDLPKESTLATVMTVDPAISTTAQGDFSAFVVVSFDYHGNWYVRELRRIRGLGVPGIIETVYDIWDAFKNLGKGHRIEAIGIESIGFQRTLLTIFQNSWAVDGREQLPIIGVEPSREASKEWRIKRVAPALAAGKIHLPAPVPDRPLTMLEQRRALPEDFEALISEGERFPMGAHDDCLDALSMVMDLPFIPTAPVEKEVETLTQRCRRGMRQASSTVHWDPVLGTEW